MVSFRRSFACVALFATIWSADAPGQSKVTVETTNGKHRLIRDGSPYFIRGAGGSTRLAELAATGGNSIRTWSTDGLGTILDEAHKHGLTVCVGFWLGHERHGFDYSDRAAVAKQLDACAAAVRKHKGHPAVLMWAVGNEMEGDGTNPKIWAAVDAIAGECKRLDPDHPTMTVIAESIDDKVRSITKLCPNIDVIGLNSYGSIPTLAERYRAAGGDKPYVVTEFGPRGHWEIAKTRWGAPIEPTSTAKAKSYADGYRDAVAGEKNLCLGSYAFLWGHKQEATATWFGLLLPDGSRTGAVDVMTEAWTGSPAKNLCPQIESVTLEKTDHLKPGETVRATVVTRDPEGDRLTINWVLRHDSVTLPTGGDAQAEEPSYPDAVTGDGAEVTLKVPAGGGGYRLFAYVRDNHGGAAVANVPLFVDGPDLAVPAPKAELPVTLFADGAKPSPYESSGYMGNTGAIRMTPDSADDPHSGKTCLKVEYTAGDDWGGVLWQSPANDWEGRKPGGLNLTGAKELEFWVRGAEGGETVNFLVGGSGGDAPYRDTDKAEIRELRLTTEWRKLRVPLDGRDLSRIKTGFGWSLAGQGKPVTFYLDDIRFVGE